MLIGLLSSTPSQDLQHTCTLTGHRLWGRHNAFSKNKTPHLQCYFLSLYIKCKDIFLYIYILHKYTWLLDLRETVFPASGDGHNETLSGRPGDISPEIIRETLVQTNVQGLRATGRSLLYAEAHFLVPTAGPLILDPPNTEEVLHAGRNPISCSRLCRNASNSKPNSTL